jgi:hypothetical protein
VRTSRQQARQRPLQRVCREVPRLAFDPDDEPWLGFRPRLRSGR